MVNPKRVEQKLPLLITNGPSWSWEAEEKMHLVMKLKRENPDLFNSHRHKIISDFEALERDVLLQKKRRNGFAVGNLNHGIGGPFDVKPNGRR